MLLQLEIYSTAPKHMLSGLKTFTGQTVRADNPTELEFLSVCAGYIKAGSVDERVFLSGKIRGTLRWQTWVDVEESVMV